MPKKSFISLIPREGIMKIKSVLFTILIFVNLSILAQNGIVHGTVVNENQEGMGNVTVKAEPGGFLATTDASGKFTFAGLPSGRIRITASFNGFEDAADDLENETGNDRLQILLAMKMKVNPTKEVVIIGYARQIKKDVIGNISKIKAQELTVNPGLSFDASLQGKAPGIQVIQSGGIAGAGALIRIRGIASVSASGEPLYVVDGMPINQEQFIQIGNGISGQQNNPISYLNIFDIESVEILKDAASAGIYGSRGANGVVYITTKRASLKAPNKLTLISSFGTSNPTVTLPMLDSKKWLQLYQEAWTNDGNAGPATLPDGIQWSEAQATNTNWVKEVTRLGLKQETNASYTYSAGKRWRFYNSFGYLNAGSFIKDNNFRRYSGRLNADVEINSKTRLRFGLSMSDSRNNRQSQSIQGGLGAAYSYALPIFSKDRVSGFGASGNPLLRMKYQHWFTDERRLMANASFETEVLRNVVWEMKTAVDRMVVSDNLFIEKPFFAKDGIAVSQQKSFSQLSDYAADNVLLNTNFVYYLRKTSKTDLNILFGGEYQTANIQTKQFKTEGLDRALSASDFSTKFTVNNEAWAFLSSFVRFNARISGKWLFQGSYRMDGSSRFGANNRFGHFPSLAMGYLMSEEAWLKESKTINFLKFRGGWGYVGSSAIPNFIQFGTYGNAANGNTYGGQQILQPLNLANPNLKWEMCEVIDGGVEFSMFKNRFYFEFSGYKRQTKDVLLDSRIPGSSGAVNGNGQYRYFQNIGTVINKGVEMLVNIVLVDKQKRDSRFAWQVKGNFMHNENKVVNMGFIDPDAIVGGGETRILENQPIGVFYLVKYSHVDQATGKPVFLDKNGKETFEYSLNNRVIAGTVQPKFIGFVENRFDLNRWGFAFSFYGVAGGKIYDEGAKYQFTMLSGGNVQEGLTDRWQKPGDNAAFAKLSLNPLNYGGLDNVSNYHTTQWLYDASYVRLRELSIKYKIKEDKGGKSAIKTATLLLSGYNLWLFTKYPGDPEVIRDYSVATQRNIGTAVNNLSPPQERSFMLTLKLEL